MAKSPVKTPVKKKVTAVAEPTKPVIKRRSKKNPVVIESLVSAVPETTTDDTKDIVVNLPDDTAPVSESKSGLPHGVIVANLLIALLVGLGILVWNYNTNWNKPVTKAEISIPSVPSVPVANPFSVAKSPSETKIEQFVTVTPPITVEDKPVVAVTPTIPPAPAPPEPVKVAVNDNAKFLPNLALTPGAVDTTATKEVVCDGYSRRVRKLIGQKNKLKVFNTYNVDWKSDNFEVDHLVPLGLGGANVVENLWPQSYTTKPWNAHDKDKLEAELHRMVCSGKMDLKEAQDTIKTDWVEAYKKIVKE